MYIVQGAPIKNNPLEKILYFSKYGSIGLRQTFTLYVRVFTDKV